MIPRNPNKPQKPKKTGADLAVLLANRCRRYLKQVPVECRSFAFALVKSAIAELEKADAPAAEPVSATETF